MQPKRKLTKFSVYNTWTDINISELKKAPEIQRPLLNLRTSKIKGTTLTKTYKISITYP